jgi:hypothetical protein
LITTNAVVEEFAICDTDGAIIICEAVQFMVKALEVILLITIF